MNVVGGGMICPCVLIGEVDIYGAVRGVGGLKVR
jgi:hypothetical protein